MVVDLPTSEHEPLWDHLVAAPFLSLDSELIGLAGFFAAESDRFGFHGLQASLAGDLLLGAVQRRLDLPRVRRTGLPGPRPLCGRISPGGFPWPMLPWRAVSA